MKHYRRRALALTLVACLLLSSMIYTLPVLASPGVPLTSVTYEPVVLPENGAEGLTASLRDCFWQYDSASRAITYRGGWSAGCLTAAGYQAFTHINQSSNTWLTRDTTDQWQSPAGTIERTSLEMHAATGEGFATVLGYTAPVSGTMSFSFDSFTPSEGCLFAIFVGQRMVFPTPDLDFAAANDPAAWFTVTGVTDQVELNRLLDNLLVPVAEGETVSFAFRRGTGGKMYVNPRVTYRTAAAPALTTSRFCFRGENFPVYGGGQGAYTLAENCGDNWSIGSIPRDGSTPYTPFNRIDPTYCIINRGGTDQWTYGGLYLQNGVVITANDYITILNYEAPASGRVSVRVSNITSAQSNGQDMLFCILKNEQMIWPQSGGTLTNYDHWFNLTAEGASVSYATAMSATLQDIRVKAGDNIRYCLVARTGHSMTTKDLDLSVSYISIDSSLPRPSEAGSTLAANYPVMRDPAAGGGLLAYRGRWQYAAATCGDTLLPLYDTDGENNFLPGKDKTEGYLATLYQGGAAAGLCPSAFFDLGVRYEVRYSGRVALTLGALPVGTDTYTVTLEKNGTVLSSTTGTPEQLAAYRHGFGAYAGDIISIRVSLPEGGEGAEPLYIAPALTYEQLFDEVAITGVSMKLTSDLAVQIYTAASVSYFEAREHGLLVWRTPQADYDAAREEAEVIKADSLPTNTCLYTYKGLTATDMGKSIYLRPYVKTAEGKTVYGGVVRFSIVEYATALYGENSLRNRMITDMLLYGAAAQQYFGVATDDLVTGRLTEAQLACATQVGSLYAGESRLSEADEDTIYTTFESITLLLGNSLSMRVYASIDFTEEDSTFIEVSTSPSFTNAKLYRLKNGYATINDIPVAETGKTLYMRIRTAAYGRFRYSQTLTYSVEAYAAGTSQTADALHSEMIAALLAYGNSARAYAYERDLAQKGR